MCANGENRMLEIKFLENYFATFKFNIRIFNERGPREIRAINYVRRTIIASWLINSYLIRYNLEPCAFKRVSTYTFET